MQINCCYLNYFNLFYQLIAIAVKNYFNLSSNQQRVKESFPTRHFFQPHKTSKGSKNSTSYLFPSAAQKNFHSTFTLFVTTPGNSTLSISFMTSLEMRLRTVLCKKVTQYLLTQMTYLQLPCCFYSFYLHKWSSCCKKIEKV